MKIGIFCEIGWSIHRVFLDVSKNLPEYTFDFLDWSCYTFEQLMNFINTSDVIITTSYASVCGFDNLKYFPIEKTLFICHGAGEIEGKELPSGFMYGMTSDKLKHLFPNNKHFITPNGVDHSLFEHKETNGQIEKIGWCGAPNVHVKQISWAIDIANRTDTPLNICSSIPCEHDVKMWQRLPFENVIKWYKTIDVLLVTSVPDERCESGPLPAFEAIVSGVPVIGTPVGNFANIPGPKFRTIEEGVEIINRLKHNPEEVKRIAKEQYEYVMKNNTYEAVIHLWRKAIYYVYLNSIKSV